MTWIMISRIMRSTLIVLQISRRTICPSHKKVIVVILTLTTYNRTSKHHHGTCTNSLLSQFDFPQNAAVLAGHQTILNCRSETNIWWKYKSRAEPTKEVVLFKDGNFSADCERCMINSTEPKHFDLIIKNTRLSDAGTYVCVEVFINTSNYSVTEHHCWIDCYWVRSWMQNKPDWSGWTFAGKWLSVDVVRQWVQRELWANGVMEKRNYRRNHIVSANYQVQTET